MNSYNPSLLGSGGVHVPDSAREGHISIILYALLRINIAPNILTLLISQSPTLSEDILWKPASS